MSTDRPFVDICPVLLLRRTHAACHADAPGGAPRRQAAGDCAKPAGPCAAASGCTSGFGNSGIGAGDRVAITARTASHQLPSACCRLAGSAGVVPIERRLGSAQHMLSAAARDRCKTSAGPRHARSGRASRSRRSGPSAPRRRSAGSIVRSRCGRARRHAATIKPSDLGRSLTRRQ